VSENPHENVRNKSLVSGSWNLENDTTHGQTGSTQQTAADRWPTDQVNAWQAERGSCPTRATSSRVSEEDVTRTLRGNCSRGISALPRAIENKESNRQLSRRVRIGRARAREMHCDVISARFRFHFLRCRLVSRTTVREVRRHRSISGYYRAIYSTQVTASCLLRRRRIGRSIVFARLRTYGLHSSLSPCEFAFICTASLSIRLFLQGRIPNRSGT